MGFITDVLSFAAVLNRLSFVTLAYYSLHLAATVNVYKTDKLSQYITEKTKRNVGAVKNHMFMIDMKLEAQQSAEKLVRRLGNPSNLVFYYEYYVT